MDNLIHRLARHFNLTRPYLRDVVQKFIQDELLSLNDNKLSLNVLCNPIRAKILEVISVYPGIYINYLKKKVNVGPNQLLWHLSVLEDCKLIEKHEFGQIYAYSKAGTSNKSIIPGIVYLKITMRKILIQLFEHNSMDQKAISANTDLTRSTILYNLKALEDINLIQKKKKNRSNLYFLNGNFTEILATVKSNYSKLSVAQ